MHPFIDSIFKGVNNAGTAVWNSPTTVAKAVREHQGNKVTIKLVKSVESKEDPQPVPEGTMMGGFFDDDIEVSPEIAAQVEGFRTASISKAEAVREEARKEKEKKAAAKAEKEAKKEAKKDDKSDKKDEKTAVGDYDKNLAMAWPCFGASFEKEEVAPAAAQEVKTAETSSTAVAQTVTPPAAKTTTKASAKREKVTPTPKFEVKGEPNISDELSREAVSFFHQKFDSIETEVVLGKENFSDEDLVGLVDNESLREKLSPGEQAKLEDVNGRRIIFTSTPQGIVLVYGHPPKNPTNLLCHAPAVYLETGMIRVNDEYGHITGFEVTRILGDIAGNMPNIGQSLAVLTA